MPRTIDETQTDRVVVDHPYIEREEPMVFNAAGTDVTTDATFTATTTHEWSHRLGEIITARMDEGMEITGLVEHDSVPWEPMPGQMTQDEAGEWRLTGGP